jgi:hypothetical protein
MHGIYLRSILLLALAVALLVPACSSESFDDGDTGDVFMVFTAFDAPPVRANRTTQTQGTCSVSGALCDVNADCGINEVCVRAAECLLEVEEWSVTVGAEPKNPLAIEPFNDIVMLTVDIVYTWNNPALASPPQTVGLGNVAIPAGGTGTVTFPPIATDIVNNNPAFEGASADLLLTFTGRTLEGTTLRQTAARQLIIELCN